MRPSPRSNTIPHHATTCTECEEALGMRRPPPSWMAHGHSRFLEPSPASLSPPVLRSMRQGASVPRKPSVGAGVVPLRRGSTAPSLEGLSHREREALQTPRTEDLGGSVPRARWPGDAPEPIRRYRRGPSSSSVANSRGVSRTDSKSILTGLRRPPRTSHVCPHGVRTRAGGHGGIIPPFPVSLLSSRLPASSSSDSAGRSARSASLFECF